MPTTPPQDRQEISGQTTEACDSLLEIPYQQLSATALRGVLEEFISREGTDYGAVELSLEEKCQRAVGRLERGEVCILFDADSERCQMVDREQWQRYD